MTEDIEIEGVLQTLTELAGTYRMGISYYIQTN